MWLTPWCYNHQTVLNSMVLQLSDSVVNTMVLQPSDYPVNSMVLLAPDCVINTMVRLASDLVILKDQYSGNIVIRSRSWLQNSMVRTTVITMVLRLPRLIQFDTTLNMLLWSSYSCGDQGQETIIANIYHYDPNWNIFFTLQRDKYI